MKAIPRLDSWFQKKLWIGNKLGRTSFGLAKLSKVGIIGSDVFTKFEVIIDNPNYCLWATSIPNQEASRSIPKKVITILTCHQYTAIKAKVDLTLPPSPAEDIKRICEEFPTVWASHKLQCGKVLANICVVGPDPPPQKQY